MAGDGQTSRRWRTKIRPQFRQQGATNNEPCWICNQPINYTLTDTTDDNTWEPDHFYPRSTHPQHAEDITNLRHSHRGCNRKRSNKKHTDMHTLGTPTRNWFG